MITVPPGGAALGLNDRIKGKGPRTLNGKLEWTVPARVTIVIGPVVAPDGTEAVIRLSETTVNGAGVPPKSTPVVPMKPDPWIVTAVPSVPLLGMMELMTGSAKAKTSNSVELVAVPAGPTT